MEFLKVSEVAHILRYQERTIRRMCKDGQFDARKIGPHWRIPRPAVEEVLSKNADARSVPA